MPNQQLAIRLLGEFNVTYCDEAVTALNTPRLQSLLAYLVLHRDAAQLRQHLAFVFWPDSNEAQARTNLRHLFHLLREALPDADRFIQTDALSIQWRPDASFRLDAVDFESAARASSLMGLQEAIDLYQGDLLPSCYEDWILPVRERLRQTFMQALTRLVALLEQEHDDATAIRYAQRQLQFDSLHEASYRQLMRLYALSGNQAGVRRTYQECVTVLQRELAAEPSPTTQQAFEQLAGMDIQPNQQNLPIQLTSFVGREQELSQIAYLLADPACRLLTITGVGGIGKTRLAIQAAQRCVGAYLHGVYFVPLTSISSPDLFISALADSIGFSFHGPLHPQMQLLNYLAEKEMLLVLDSFEHLLASDTLVAEILKRAHAVKLLVTSRERLQLHGEWLFEPQGLAVPQANHADELEEYSAVQLFVQSARRVQGGFSLSVEHKPAVIRLCQLVGGMPLALELAAAWVRLLSCQEIGQELAQSLDLLTTPLHNVPERQRSIRAVFDHSWNMLSIEERNVFQRLSIFRDGFRRQAAERVAGASLTLLSTLVDKSLVHWQRAGRYQMHELLQQYAAEKLDGIAAEKEAVQDRHAHYYLEFLREQEKRLKSSQAQQALVEIRADVNNVRLAWQWAVEHCWAKELGQATQTIWLFYDAQGWYQEAETILGQAVEALHAGAAIEEREREIGLGQLLAQQGWFLMQLGQVRRAKTLFQRSVALLRRWSAEVELAATMQVFSMVAWVGGDYLGAKTMLQEGLAIFRQQNSLWDLALCHICLGNVAALLGDNRRAKFYLEEALVLARITGEPKVTALALNYLGPFAYALGDYTEAKQWSQESLALSREIDDRWSMIMSLNRLGTLTHQGSMADWPEAKHLYEESLSIAKDLGNPREMAIALNHLGYVTYALADYPAAHEHFLAALQTATEAQVTPVALDALVGLATLLSQHDVGQAEPGPTKKEWAVELVSLVIRHPASSQEIKEKAQHLRAGLETELPSQVMAAAQEGAQIHSLEEVVAALLAKRT